MNEKPILMSAPMVVAILEGRKTQTRRVMKPQPIIEPLLNGATVSKTDCRINWDVRNGAAWAESIKNPKAPVRCGACPFTAGQRLWVREAWSAYEDKDGAAICYEADDALNYTPIELSTSWNDEQNNWKWLEGDNHRRTLKKPSIFMPRWASRLTLEIVSVRVERVQEISEADALAEGIEKHYKHDGGRKMHHAWTYKAFPDKPGGLHSARDAFEFLWDSINAKRGYGWDNNPWVWVIEFKNLAVGTVPNAMPLTCRDGDAHCAFSK